MTEPPQEPGPHNGEKSTTLGRALDLAGRSETWWFILPFLLAAVGGVFHLAGTVCGVPWMIGVSGWLMVPFTCLIGFLVLLPLPLSLLFGWWRDGGGPTPPAGG